MTGEFEVAGCWREVDRAIARWVEKVAAHTRPARIYYCGEGDRSHNDLLRACAAESYRRLDGREPVEYLCTPRAVDAGPTNQWITRSAAEQRCWQRLRGSMRGRTMYVVPYLLGPPGAYLGRPGVELTDSPHAALAMKKISLVGQAALEGATATFAKLVHSGVAAPQDPPCTVHHPDDQEVWSVGSDAERSAVLAPTAHALRLASHAAVHEGWLLARGSLVAVTPPAKPPRYFVVDFSRLDDAERVAAEAACPPGWRVQVAVSHACFLHIARDGRLWAIAAEQQPPRSSRGGVPSLPVLGDYRGVPISGIAFAVRRAATAPLLLEARSWRHGVYLGASLLTDRSPRNGEPQRLEHDPFGMARDCGVSMGDFLEHWIAFGRQLNVQPRIFCMNLSQLDEAGAPAWPGGPETARLLAWMYGRCAGERSARSTPVGLVPDVEAPAFTGVPMSRDRLERLLAVDPGSWLAETERVGDYFLRFGSRAPLGLLRELAAQRDRLARSIH